MNRILISIACALIPIACSTSGGWTFPERNLDRTVSPAVDFYDFATGGWRRAHPIPRDEGRWGTFDVVAQRTRDRLHRILEEARTAHAPEGSDTQKIGDLYTSGMDVEAIDAAGATPILPELQRIDAIADLDALQSEIARLQEIGEDAAFDFGRVPDPRCSTRYIGAADQGGLGLPDRSYYVDDDARGRSVRVAYVRHVAAMLELAGEPEEDAARDAAATVRIETALAGASSTRAARRDPYATYHPMDRDALAALTPHFSWPRWFSLVGRPDIERINVAEPAFFQELDRLLVGEDLDAWKGYLRWHLVDATAPYLSSDFERESFAFRSMLTGVEREAPRWERVLGAVNRTVGFALGKIYVDRHFSAAEKAEAEALLADVRAALRADLRTLPWMSPPTRRRAIEKLDLMTARVGYPDRWRDYRGLAIDRGPYVLNVMRGAAWAWRRAMDQIGERVDREEWEMLPQTVNAYYDPSLNVIVFPAAILQPPFFDPSAPRAWSYGAIGAVMGHEITHGFDDEGSRYDGHGNLVDWWTPADAEKFHARTQCIADQFSQFTVPGGAHVNGALVTGEATADLGGVVLAYRAFEATNSGEDAQRAPGVATIGSVGAKPLPETPEQIFFLSFAGIWAANIRPEEAALLVLVDPHPPARFRVNGTLGNVPEFQRAFDVPADSPMVHRPRCDIW